MEDALWAQLQNTSIEDIKEVTRAEPETDSENEEQDDHSNDLISQSERTTGPQTGPKGVKADHDYQQQMKLASAAKARAEYNARMLAKAPTTTTYAQDQEELLILQKLKLGNHSIRKQQKLFGSVSTIDADDYAQEIDHEWKTVPVIVHIYDLQLPTCLQLDDYLRELAQKYTLAKFIRISAEELDFDLVGSPTILAYQGGSLVSNLVRFVDHVGSRFDVDTVEDALLRYGALSENDLYDIPKPEDSDEDEED
ncbi:thioredoxin-like protein [Choanephora cucurbitarum]|nr:thioredoxin-like protein [Choanephora cucurbitarum]